MFTCKFVLKYRLSVLFLQEYTDGRTGGISMWAGGKKMRLAGTQKYTISKGSRVIVQ